MSTYSLEDLGPSDPITDIRTHEYALHEFVYYKNQTATKSKSIENPLRSRQSNIPKLTITTEDDFVETSSRRCLVE